MNSRSFNAAAVTSLLLSIATMTAIARCANRSYQVYFHGHHYEVSLSPGLSCYEVVSTPPLELERFRYVFATRLGLFPLLYVTMLLPGFWLVRRLRPPHKSGFCRVCGYDLCATPHQCPECGSVT